MPGRPEDKPEAVGAASVPMESEPTDDAEKAEPPTPATPAEAAKPEATAPATIQQSSTELPREAPPPPENAYGYREPRDKYPPQETEAAPEQAEPKPVR
jgi:hypothetical protein